MAEGDFTGREQSYYQSVGQILGSIAVDATKADLLQKRAVIGLLESLLYQVDPKTGKIDPTKPVANVDVHAQVDLPPIDGTSIGSVNATLSLPPVLLVPPTALTIKTVTAKGSMAVSSSTADTKSLSAKEGITGEGKVGWGPFSVSVKVTGEASQSEVSSRKSDYRARLDWTLEMDQEPMSEAFQRMTDGLIKSVVDTGLKLFDQIVTEEVEAAAKKAGLNPPPPDDDGGGGGGGGGGNGGNGGG